MGTTQGDLMVAQWPYGLYEHKSAAKEGRTWCGLRVRMACHVGIGAKVMNQATNRLNYQGPVVNECTAILKATDAGGVVVTSMNTIADLQGKFSHKVSELGAFKIQDIGTWMLPGFVDPNAEIAFVFCTLKMGSAGAAKGATTMMDDMKKADKRAEKGGAVKNAKAHEAALSELIRTTAFANNGYVTKTSNGVSLLSFHSASEGCRFIKAMIDAAAGNSDYVFYGGLHVGKPSSAFPNKGSGRCDYLGPPVNTSARILSLAAEKPEFKKGGGTFGGAVGEPAYQKLESAEQAMLEPAGKFSMKGVSEPMQCYAF